MGRSGLRVGIGPLSKLALVLVLGMAMGRLE